MEVLDKHVTKETFSTLLGNSITWLGMQRSIRWSKSWYSENLVSNSEIMSLECIITIYFFFFLLVLNLYSLTEVIALKYEKLNSKITLK